MTKYVYPFDPQAQNNTAATVYQAVRRGGPRVLDVGSGPGIVAGALASFDGKDVTCVDFDAEALDQAAAGGVTSTHVVDLRDGRWFTPLIGKSYDTVLLADVLEHVVDPDRVLRDIAREHLVTDDGALVISIPNANHESVLLELATGHFRYTDTGLLDVTHVRFFTLESITVLLESCGFHVVEVHRTTKGFEHTQHNYRAQETWPELRQALKTLGLEGRTYQYILVARPSSQAARITELTEELERLRRRVHDTSVEAENQQAAAHRKLESMQALLEEERTEHDRALRAGGERIAALEVEKARLSLSLAGIKRSATFKAGARVVRAGRSLRRARRLASVLRRRRASGTA